MKYLDKDKAARTKFTIRAIAAHLGRLR